MNQYKTYLEWIKKQYPSQLRHLKSWASINSFTDNIDGLNALVNRLKDDFSILQGEQTLIPLPPRKIIGPGGKRIEMPVGQALRIRKRALAPIQIFLAGHMDTVYSPSHPFQKVEEINSTTWRGPGVTDMKGGLVILLFALAALEHSPDAHMIGWEVLINPDEEVGSLSSAPLFEEAAKRHTIGLIFEPSFADGAFVNRRKGSSTYTIIARGRPAHAGRDFLEGRNAIYALSHFIRLLEEMNQHINVGYIEGGGPVNIVPDLALCKINLRSADPAIIADFPAKLEEIAYQCRQRDGIQIEVHTNTMRLPKPFDSKTQSLFDQLEKCARQLDIPFQMRESGGVCDGNILASAGLPTIDSLGAVGGQIHTPDEFIHLPSLVERCQLTTLLLLKLATNEIIIDKDKIYE